MVTLCLFVGSTIALPSLHIFNHWDDHIHTPEGAIYVDGQSAEQPDSVEDLRAEIRRAAFGQVNPHNDVAALSARFSSSAQLSVPDAQRAGQHAGVHGSGSLLHFGVVFQSGSPTIDVDWFVILLRRLTPPDAQGLIDVCAALPLHNRGPPTLG